jgi:hypothetical protein
MAMDPAGKRMTNAREARTPWAMRCFLVLGSLEEMVVTPELAPPLLGSVSQ